MPSLNHFTTKKSLTQFSREFRVNEYITLKLENGKTHIYINGIKFKQCKYLLLNIPLNSTEPLEEIDSIDKAALKLDRSLEGNGEKKIKIAPKTEFWGHCSNLQVWSEQNYDTRLLHSNLAFPLLKKLADVGDLLAVKKFKEEVARRISKGGPYIIEFVLEENYLDLFTKEELTVLFKDIDFANLPSQKYKAIFPLLKKVSELGMINVDQIFRKEIKRGFESREKSLIRYLIQEGFLKYLQNGDKEIILSNLRENNALQSILGRRDDDNNLIELDLSKWGLKSFPNILTNFSSLKRLNLECNNLTNLPESIFRLKALKSLDLKRNHLKNLPETIEKLKCLKILHLEHNNLKELPKAIGTLQSLKELHIGYNEISQIPKSMENLASLQILQIQENNLNRLPKSIGNLTSLEFLDVHGNLLYKVPESIGELNSLLKLDLSDNKINNIPDSIGNLTSLEVLNVRKNQIKYLPDTIEYAESIQELCLRENFLEILPKSIKYLRRLKKLELYYNNFTTFPEVIFRLKNLEELWLEDNIIAFLFNRKNRRILKEKYGDNSFKSLNLTPLKAFNGLQILEIHPSTNLYWEGRELPKKNSLPKVLHRYYPRLILKKPQ